MRKIKLIASFAISFISLFSSASAYGEITIEDCVKKAEENYPIIRKYDILSSTREIELDDINKGWLPRIGAYLQGTGQNVVPKYPEALSGVLQQMGHEVKGLGKIQYKLGVDLSQTIWDGGASKVSRELVKSQEEVKRASLNVELYQVRERVENLFFAIKLIEEQIAQNEITYNLLHANLEK
ncbi:MAG: TolC family protein, partial [Muribaculaceae bacterium]|nr:TolC family protein [Muribaculaceae bacterium]